jgi:shikimate kinase
MTALLPRPDKTIALVGLMGVGKTSIGRRLAHALALPFRDADQAIEEAAGCTIPEIFEKYGETAFRDGERRVISRLLDEPVHVLATGGGAFVNPDTRRLMKEKALTIWLKADLPVLARRLVRKDNRPLLTGRDPMTVLQEQAAARYGAYGEADMVVETGDTPHAHAVDSILAALRARPAEAAG